MEFFGVQPLRSHRKMPDSSSIPVQAMRVEMATVHIPMIQSRRFEQNHVLFLH
jgi:hypothetical protein